MLKPTTTVIVDKVFGARDGTTGMRPLTDDVANMLAADLSATAGITDGKTSFLRVGLTGKKTLITVYALNVPDTAAKADIHIECYSVQPNGDLVSLTQAKGSCTNLVNIIFAILLDYEGYTKKRAEEKKAIEDELLKIEPKLPEAVVKEITTKYLGLGGKGKRRTRKGKKRSKKTRKVKRSS